MTSSQRPTARAARPVATPSPRAAKKSATPQAGADPSERIAARDQRRDRRMQRTRRHLAEVAVGLFEEKGFAATTIDEIADAADYSTSTFFRMFVDKEEIVFYDFPERLEELRTRFVTPHKGNAWQTVRAAFIDYARRWDADEGGLATRRARLFHTVPQLRMRFLGKNADWEDAITELLQAELGHDAEGRLSASMIAGAAVAAFRSAWRAQLATSGLKIEDCVRTAFDQLERIGPFFRAKPRS